MLCSRPSPLRPADAPKKIVGSVIVYEASSIEEVEQTLKNDIFYRSGVVRVFSPWTALANSSQWDLEKIVILPFLVAPL